MINDNNNRFQWGSRHPLKTTAQHQTSHDPVHVNMPVTGNFWKGQKTVNLRQTTVNCFLIVLFVLHNASKNTGLELYLKLSPQAEIWQP